MFNINDKVKIINQNWIYPGGAGMERELNATKFKHHYGWTEELNNKNGVIINKAISEEELWFYLVDIGDKEIILAPEAIEKI